MGHILPGCLEQAHCHVALYRGLSCSTSSSMTWRRWRSILPTKLQMIPHWEEYTWGHVCHSERPRQAVDLDRLTGILWNLTIIYAVLHLDVLADRRLNMGQQHALAPKMANSIPCCTKHRQKIQASDYHSWHLLDRIWNTAYSFRFPTKTKLLMNWREFSREPQRWLRTRDNEQKLKKGFLTGHKKNFFTMRTAKHYSRLPRDVVQSPSFQIFKTQLNKTISKLI